MRLVLDSAASNVYLWQSGHEQPFERSATLFAMNGRRTVNLRQMQVLVVGDQIFHMLDAVMTPRPKEERVDDGLLPASLFRSVYVNNSESYVRLQR